MAHPYEVEHAFDLHITWCRELAERLGVTTTHQSGPQLRAVMLELREVLAPSCVLALANALPALERGIFLEGWSLDHAPAQLTDADEFRDRVYRRVMGHHARIDDLVETVFAFLDEKIDPASAQVRACLPAPLRPLWPCRDAPSSPP